MMALPRRLRAMFAAQTDLLAWWWLLVCLRALVPAAHAVSRTDLMPWMAIALAGAVGVRGGDRGEGAHPQLRPRRSPAAANVGLIGAVLVPLTVLATTEYARDPSPTSGRLAAGLLAVVLIARRISLEDGRTAWRPPGNEGVWIVGSLLGLLAPAVVIGWLSDALREGTPVTPAGRWIAAQDLAWVVRPATGALFASLSFLAISVYQARPVHRWQRVAAGRRDGSKWRPPLYPTVLTVLGPASGWMAVRMLVERFGGPVDFGFAYAAALHVIVWAAVLWRRPTPTAVLCVLREMEPVGGRDAEGAGAFDQPPEGALRLHPLDVRPTLRFHVWVVPVQQARIDELDDPIAPLFQRGPVAVGHNVLGEASFALDPLTRDVQTHTLTIHLRGQVDTGSVRPGDDQVRRILAMRAFPPPEGTGRRTRATWAWDATLDADTCQIVDASTQQLLLWDGSLLILSSEGVARIFELRTAHALDNWHRLDGPVPEMEDYASP